MNPHRRTAALALIAVKDARHQPTVLRLAGYLKKQASGYAAKSPEGAAKLAILAVSLGRSRPISAESTSLPRLRAGVQADGSFGAYPGPFAQSLGLVAPLPGRTAVARLDGELAGRQSGQGRPAATATLPGNRLTPTAPAWHWWHCP